MPKNEVQYVSSTVHAIVITTDLITLFCADGVSREFTREEFKIISSDVRDSGPDTYYKRLGVESLLLRRPSHDLISDWFNHK